MDRPIFSFLRRFVAWLRRTWQAVLPGRRAWAGAALGLLAVMLVFLIPAMRSNFGSLGPSGIAMGLFIFLLAGALAAALAAALAWLLRRLLAVVPGIYVAVAAGVWMVIYLSMIPVTLLDPTMKYPRVVLAALAVASLLGAAVWALLRGGWKGASTAQRVIIGAGLVLGVAGAGSGGAWLLGDGRPVAPPPNVVAQAVAKVTPLSLPDPSQPGEYPVRTLFYGSGQDPYRPEYGADVDITTQPVDGSILVQGWSMLRRDHWGFGPEAMPLNGRVWYPEGAGPFPLVLMVHGNAAAETYSDPGYAYLGELFASRGWIAVSVDENFLNVSPAADMGVLFPLIEEDDARGWLLLEHLRAWRSWNEDPAQPFYGRVDLQRVALIGHSRGGEAVAVAAAFNHLPYCPDNAALAFDYGFGIRAVAAIAPIDGQYRPGGQSLPLENVSYFVLHGALDMQTPFAGRRMYDRLRFTGPDSYFKSALYIYGANHGQFNTVWGRKEILEPGGRLFNYIPLMPAQDQQQIAKVYLSAFLETTLHDETGYLPLFRNARYAPGWLPDTIYLAQYHDTATRLVSTFEDDLDLTTANLPGGVQQGENLTVWHEQRIVARDYSRLDTRAAYLGWDTQANPAPASYTVHLPEQGLALDERSTLVLALGDANETSGPPIDLTVELIDRGGHTARLPLSHYAPVQPRIRSTILKADWLSAYPQSEIVLQNFEFSCADFVQANPDLDPTALDQVRLIFDRTPAGVIVLDDLGFR